MEIRNVTVKISELTTPVEGWRYHSGTAIYIERFRDGRLLAASLQDTGIPHYTEDEETGTPAFDLVVDGESLAFGWELVESGVTAQTHHLTLRRTRLHLRHTLKPVELEIVTLAGGGGFFRRQLRLTNTSPSATLSLTSAGAAGGHDLADGRQPA